MESRRQGGEVWRNLLVHKLLNRALFRLVASAALAVTIVTIFSWIYGKSARWAREKNQFRKFRTSKKACIVFGDGRKGIKFRLFVCIRELKLDLKPKILRHVNLLFKLHFLAKIDFWHNNI